MPTHAPVSRLFAGSLVALALCATLAGCKKSADNVAAPEAVAVQAEKAELKDLTEYATGDAVLSPLAQSAIVPKLSAPVKRFYVQRGAHVKQGQLLAKLEAADLAAALTDNSGSLQQAQAAFETATRAQIPEDRQKAQLDVAQNQANLDVAKSVLDARKRLLDQGAIPRRDFDTANASYVQAKAAYDIAVQHLAALQSVSQQASINNAQGALASARGKYQGAAASLGYSEIRSPISGVVTDRPLFAGEMAQAGAPLLTVMDTSSLIAKVHVAQAEGQEMKVGSDALLTMDGVDKPIAGKVSLVSPALDTGSTTLEVWVKVSNKDGELKAGSPAHVRIAVQTLRNIVSVPNEALVTTKAGDPAVMVVAADGTAKSTPVKTGITDGHDTEILSGIKAGDTVITKGAFGMDDGTKVKIAAPGAEDDDKPAAGKAADDAAGKGDEK